ncbi:RPA-related protein RADX isoform X2 [Sceloporus undulatus]|uniref:RPA-related protein RADX isoform X2 n=1 Tax=Sceloporus undulatus TaxID=8520 RepID=UPI001C4C9FC6|nr:RPA-related protein RADX isoform X2 [Sceloporus undulatus]
MAAGKEAGKEASGLLREASEGTAPSGEGGSWIPRTFAAVFRSSSFRLSIGESRLEAVTVLALERYAADLPPPSLCTWQRPPAAPWPSYYYDVTLWDGALAERCHLSPELNPLVHSNALRCGARLRVTRCSYVYNEKKMRYGFLCLERLQLLPGEEEEGGPLPPLGPGGREEYSQKPPGPLRGAKVHYLPLWDNEQPCGEIWAQKEPGPGASVDESKLTSLLHLELSWRTKLNVKPLLVRIMHKSRLRYYGKPETKFDIPYQAYFEVADHSGMMSMVLWNALCPEWYNSMKIGTVLLLEQYAVKTSYPFRTHPAPGDLHMQRFSSIEITLNVRDPPTKINIIPEHKVKAEWKLPEVKYQFITRSELDNLPNNHFCDIIGLVQYVGRTERTRKREHGEDFWIYRWVHVIDGTSEQPFILELFATSQPEIFEQIHPMTYLVCTQMRVIRDTAENKSCPIYLTTSNESQIFITGWHKGQPYTKDTKVKNFIQWIKTQKEASHMERMAMGGYYPFPPVPDAFWKYCKNLKVESVLTTIREMEKKIESLHYREHKRIAFPGIISAIRYVSCSNTSQDASEVEPMQITRRSSLQTFVTDNEHNDHVKEGSKRYPQTEEATSMRRSPSVEQQHIETRKGRAKRKIAAVETRDPPETPQSSYFTRSANKRIMLHKQNLLSKNKSQDVKEATQSSKNNKEIADVSVRVQAERMCHNSWESALWAAVKDNLTQHLNYSSVFPESFPCKFNYTHKEFLMQQYNLQAARWKPKECVTNGKMANFESACPPEYYEVAILGINRDIAIDVAFLPVCCPEDSHLFRTEGAPSYAVSHPSDTSCPQETVNKEGHSEIVSLSDEVVKAAADLEKQHVICILDICSLGENKVEVFLNKVYKITDADIAHQT